PRHAGPTPAADAPAPGATGVLDQARLFDSAAEAVADLTKIYATTARNRGMLKPITSPRQAATEMQGRIAGGHRVGVLFGAEAAGLTNDELVLADKIIQIPTDPDFSSLNIAQAVLLVAYEWHLMDAGAPAEILPQGENRP